MTEENKLKIEFAPGCFDDFEGTQEELNELMSEITQMIQSENFQNQSNHFDIDELIDTEPELAQKVMNSLSNIQSTRNLQ